MSQWLRKSRIIGWHDGCPIWRLEGASPETDPAGSAEGDGTEGSGSEGESGKETEGTDSKPDPKDEPVSREEFNKLFARMQAADRAKTDAEKRIKEFEDKDRTELEREKNRADEAEKRLAAVQEVTRTQAVRLAFLSSSSDITWHDPEDALAFAMKDQALKDLELDDEGTVDRKVVKRVVADLVKAKPYLVKKSDGKEEDHSDDGASGHQPSGDKDKDKKTLEKQKLLEKYPALRR